jgi:L-fuculose-phosphate aldolase
MAAVAQSIQEQVAWACRILAAEGYADLTLGHVSARSPDGGIWIKRKGVALDEVEPDDVVSIEDAGAVLHLELSVLTHDGILFADGVARFGDPDLIVEDEQGDSVAAALGGRRAVLMQNHGVLVVGSDVPWAVLTAATLERAARLQSIAGTLGSLRPIAPDDARRLQPVKYRDEFVQEYWAAWQRQVARGGGGLGGDRV